MQKIPHGHRRDEHDRSDGRVCQGLGLALQKKLQRADTGEMNMTGRTVVFTTDVDNKHRPRSDGMHGENISNSG